MALTTSKTVYSAGFGPLMPSVFVAPFPYASQLPDNLTGLCPALNSFLLRNTLLNPPGGSL